MVADSATADAGAVTPDGRNRLQVGHHHSFITAEQDHHSLVSRVTSQAVTTTSSQSDLREPARHAGSDRVLLECCRQTRIYLNRTPSFGP